MKWSHYLNYTAICKASIIITTVQFSTLNPAYRSYSCISDNNQTQGQKPSMLISPTIILVLDKNEFLLAGRESAQPLLFCAAAQVWTSYLCLPFSLSSLPQSASCYSASRPDAEPPPLPSASFSWLVFVPTSHCSVCAASPPLSSLFLHCPIFNFPFSAENLSTTLQSSLHEEKKCFWFVSFVWFIHVPEQRCTGSHDLQPCGTALCVLAQLAQLSRAATNSTIVIHNWTYSVS